MIRGVSVGDADSGRPGLTLVILSVAEQRLEVVGRVATRRVPTRTHSGVSDELLGSPPKGLCVALLVAVVSTRVRLVVSRIEGGLFRSWPSTTLTLPWSGARRYSSLSSGSRNAAVARIGRSGQGDGAQFNLLVA